MGMLVRWGASTSVAGRGSRMAFSIKSGNHARKWRGKEDQDRGRDYALATFRESSGLN